VDEPYIAKNLESVSYQQVKTASYYVNSFWHNTGVWRTDGQTDMLQLIQH